MLQAEETTFDGISKWIADKTVGCVEILLYLHLGIMYADVFSGV